MNIVDAHYCTREQWNDYMRLLRFVRNDGRISRRLPPTPPEVLADYRRLWALAFPEKIKASGKRSYSKHREKRLEKNRIWSKANPEYSRAKHKRYRLKYPERYKGYDASRRKQKAKYIRERRSSDLNFRLSLVLRGRVRALVAGKDRSANTMKLLGCSIEDFKIYLESRFEPGMSWDNYGRGEGTWQIDHIMPCAIFDLRNPDHQRRCFHFSNMQPMWTIQNQRKNCNAGAGQFNLL